MKVMRLFIGFLISPAMLLALDSFAALNQQYDTFIQKKDFEKANSFCKGEHQFKATVLMTEPGYPEGVDVLLYDAGDAKVLPKSSEIRKHMIICSSKPAENTARLKTGQEVMLTGNCNGVGTGQIKLEQKYVLFSFQNCSFR